MRRFFYNSQVAFRETLQGDSFETAYAQLNRLLSKCYHLEKKRFGFRGRIRFTNCPSLVGLFCSRSATASCTEVCPAR